jgi:hypothetical protein
MSRRDRQKLRDWTGSHIINPSDEDRHDDKQRKLEFINVSSHAKDAGNVRKTIRVHVMRDLRRQQRQRREAILKTQWPTPSGSMKCSESDPLNLSSTKTVVPKQPSGYLDPFVQFPIIMQPRMYELIHQCKLLIHHHFH